MRGYNYFLWFFLWFIDYERIHLLFMVYKFVLSFSDLKELDLTGNLLSEWKVMSSDMN